MYKCNNCEKHFEKPKEILMEDFYGVYSEFGNSRGNTIDVCPYCRNDDIETVEEDDELLEDKVYNYLLENNYGKDNMIKNQDLRELFNIHSDKTMRKIIQTIREDKNYEKVVGSTSGKNGGYFICETDGEIQETIDNIKHRANQMLRMTYVLEWKKGKD